jgi:hypothetical protein
MDIPRVTPAAPFGVSLCSCIEFRASKPNVCLCPVEDDGYGAMEGKVPSVATTAAVTALLVVVTTAAVFGPQTGAELYGALLVWPLPAATALAVGVDARRLSRFAVVFCGSLVGLSLLFGTVVGYRMLGALIGVPPADVGLSVNPVMTVLAGGAIVLSYYAVFEWDCRTETPV